MTRIPSNKTYSTLPSQTGHTGDVLTSDGTAASWETPVEADAASIGLGNVNNTSDATKNSATATLTNKTIAGGSNTITGLSLTTAVTGVLPVANGGTNSATANGGLNNLLPTQTSNSGKVLQTDGTNTSWQTASGGAISRYAVAWRNGSAALLTGSGATLVEANISSVTRDALGVFTVNFTTPFTNPPAISVMSMENPGDINVSIADNPLTTGCQIRFYNTAGSAVDPSRWMLSAFGT